MDQLLNYIPLALMGKIVIGVGIFQAVLAVVKLVLDKIKDKTDTNVDNKIASVLGFFVAPLNKLVELLQGNLNSRK